MSSDDKREEVIQNILNKASRNGRFSVTVSPRFGKTIMAIRLIERLRVNKVLWVSPSRELVAVDLINEFKKWGYEHLIEKLDACTWASLKKKTGYYNLIILDEAHSITELNSSTLKERLLDASTILAMTGTKSTRNDKVELYRELGFKDIFRYEIDDAIDDGILSDYIINVVHLKLSNKQKIKMTSKKTGNSFAIPETKRYDYLDGIMKDKMQRGIRNLKMEYIQLIHFFKNGPTKNKKVKELFHRAKGRAIVFCASQVLSQWFCKDYYHSNSNKDSYNKFVDMDIEKIAMVNCGGVGSTYRQVDHIFITQCDSNKTHMNTQKICRSLINDKDHPATIWLFCYDNTKDEEFVNRTLQTFDSTKVNHIYSYSELIDEFKE